MEICLTKKYLLHPLRKFEGEIFLLVPGDTKKRELLKNPTKIEEIQEKKFIDRNWTITTCLLRDLLTYSVEQSPSWKANQ